MQFSDDVEDPSHFFRRPCPIVYIVFRSEDNRHYVSKSSKTEYIYSFWPQFFREERSHFSVVDC